jgi:hypothetical protein
MPAPFCEATAKLSVFFFASPLTENFTENSDFAVVLVFDVPVREKQKEITRIISEIEQQPTVFIDCKLFTSTGNKSIAYIRENVNPIGIPSV